MEELKFTVIKGGTLYLNGEKLMDIKSGVETSERSKIEQSVRLPDEIELTGTLEVTLES